MKHTNRQTTTHCLRCGRPLRAARSIANGYGRTCKAKVAAAAKAEIVAQYKAHLVAKAEELIEQGGIVAIRARRVFRTVSSDGTRTYLSAPQGCTCKAGLKGRHACFHRIAAHILSLAA
ncbi:DUF6011 domain-containing protein [Streptomyces sp. 549]|uniref:DUF6011 domain-containing protein n=1 Tax=Streptomyces sp. 549 TaxID=3049076 RepID=UPI0024C3815D|nr:DUF6011 domain-containing protein [Streptomyces sp. 549]MDK1473628.1 DUF6011 domain-containing protein [Streptomyces sp. 549]